MDNSAAKQGPTRDSKSAGQMDGCGGKAKNVCECDAKVCRQVKNLLATIDLLSN